MNALPVFGHDLCGQIVFVHQRAIFVAGAARVGHVQRMSSTLWMIRSKNGVRQSVAIGADGDTLILPLG